jgi:hypothetical protein
LFDKKKDLILHKERRIMIYYVDIDGTICKTEGNDYEHSQPDKSAIKKINKLFDSGHTVIYWTARGNTSGKDLYSFTLNQLLKWGCRFNLLSLKKPCFDVIIDDRAMTIKELFSHPSFEDGV